MSVIALLITLSNIFR